MKLTENEHYSFVTTNDDNKVSINILDGEYDGTEFYYGNVNFDENEESGECYLSFNFEIVKSDLDINLLSEDIDFKNYLGDILVSILSKQLEENKSIHELGTIDS